MAATLTLRVRPKSSPFCHRDVAAHGDWFLVRVPSAPPRSPTQTEISRFSANSPELAQAMEPRAAITSPDEARRIAVNNACDSRALDKPTCHLGCSKDPWQTSSALPPAGLTACVAAPAALAMFAAIRRASSRVGDLAAHFVAEGQPYTFSTRSCLVRRAMSSLNFASAGLTILSSRTSISRSTEG
jgi:hypothetical protein